MAVIKELSLENDRTCRNFSNLQKSLNNVRLAFE
jgi:hypothetical protein